MKPKFALLIYSAVAICISQQSAAQVRVIDGDTIELNGEDYRLNGIDAPEIGQNCEGQNGAWECGKMAANRLLEALELEEVRCDVHSIDPYDRYIATCRVGGIDVADLLVSEGLAWAFRKYSTDYVQQEDAARSAGIGIWQANNQPAWAFREQRWERASEAAPNPDCPIKGNISRNGMIYHAPWSPWYDRTSINESRGERWFCDELEAIEAGWRAPYWP